MDEFTREEILLLEKVLQASKPTIRKARDFASLYNKVARRAHRLTVRIVQASVCTECGDAVCRCHVIVRVP